MRRIVYIVGAAAILFGSFFITLWLTEPEVTFAPKTAADGNSAAVVPKTAADGNSAADRLASQRIVTYSDLETAAQNAGLRRSEQMKGVIDVLVRINEREVHMEGWLVDPEGSSTPPSVVVFIGGSMVAKAQTKGERLDVTSALHLTSAVKENTLFSVNVNCRTGNVPIVVGLDKKDQYIPLQPKQCP
jgi:hypothetical protein